MEAAVGDGAGVLPRTEHGADRAPELLARVLREGLAEMRLDERLVADDQRLPVVGGEVGVEDEAVVVLMGLEDFLEMMVLHAEHDVAVHLDEAAVGIVGEAGVARRCRERFHRLVVEAEIEDGVHHARHRDAGAGAHRHEQGLGLVAEAAAGQRGDVIERGVDLPHELRRIGVAVGIIIGADLGRHGEAGRHGQAEIGHFREVRPFSAQEIAQAGISFRLAIPEGVDPLGHFGLP